MNLGSLALLRPRRAIVGAAIATLLHLPAAPLLGAMVGVALVNIFTSSAFEIASAGKWIVYVVPGLAARRRSHTDDAEAAARPRPCRSS